MNSYLIYSIGLLAQILFSARLIIQWISSERARRIMTPEIFWELSLLASFLMFLYGWLRDDFAIILGQSIGYIIYIRNMQLQNSWYKLSIYLRTFLLSFPFIIIIYGFNNGEIDTIRIFNNPNIPLWLIIWGSVAQIVFISRFIYQWFVSEKTKTSHLPIEFWVLSLIGSSMILSYAIIREDPILFLGQLFGFFIYIRNIILHIKTKKDI
jgi:lipid-A-disaccharide synthase-like uncharacterized protein